MNSAFENVFVSYKQKDIIPMTDKKIYYNRFLVLTNPSKTSMESFAIRLLLSDNTWGPRYNKTKNDRYSISSTQRTPVSLKFTSEIYVEKLIYDQIVTVVANMCFSKISIPHSVH